MDDLAAAIVPSATQTFPASPTLPQHLAHLHSVGVFKVILLLVPCLPYLETFSDGVKDTIRATVG